MQLEVIDKDISKDDADKYIKITNVTYKSLQIVSVNFSDQFSVTVV